jgi:hypothetical protein
MGVATSSVTFFRQMGGTIGVAAFLSILFTTLPDKIVHAYSAARSTPAFQQAAAAHPAQIQALQANGGSVQDTSFVQKLDAALAYPFKVAFSDSITLVFLVAAAVVAIGFFVMLFLPELPLRTQSGIQAQQSGAGELTGTGEASAEDAALAAGSAAPTSVSPADEGAEHATGGAHRR